MFGSESWACHNPGPHLMDKVEHLLIAVIGFIRNTIEPESLRRAPAALIQCRDKTVSLVHPFKLFLIHICSPFSAEFRQISRPGLYDQPSAYIQPMRPSPQLLIKINKFLYSYIILPYPQKRHKISANSTKKSKAFCQKAHSFSIIYGGLNRKFTPLRQNIPKAANVRGASGSGRTDVRPLQSCRQNRKNSGRPRKYGTFTFFL